MPESEDGQQIQLGELEFSHVTRSGDVITAITHIAGIPHNATLVRIEEQEGEDRIQVAVDDPSGFFELFHGADPGADGPFLPINVPGLPGDWVLLISPCCQ